MTSNGASDLSMQRRLERIWHVAWWTLEASAVWYTFMRLTQYCTFKVLYWWSVPIISLPRLLLRLKFVKMCWVSILYYQFMSSVANWQRPLKLKNPLLESLSIYFWQTARNIKVILLDVAQPGGLALSAIRCNIFPSELNFDVNREICLLTQVSDGV